MADAVRLLLDAGPRMSKGMLRHLLPMNTSKILLATSAMLLVGTGAAQAQTFQTLPAPPGAAAEVALRVIREAEHPCPKLTRASRLPDQTIVAVCTNRENYRIFSIRNKAGRVMDLAMKCSAAKKLGISGAC
ncbi:hypothetical protein J2W28_006436 [Variovorax boronicumulans]|uniref:hypothetical protein n=1 Tax=Variovorax boronicumulans TaxID=436515 RepID=UPI00277DE82F|nr:hypothetical protein [Variovorax boronicumulans]MDP9995496.1 hypothetical protein [Variovorax boronicumulans]MDQ0007261.1 hypothetical protein [Variovorax boronicumulans]